MIVEQLRKKGAPGVLLPYQRRWIADRAEVKVAEKSRRIGLTWAEAADDVLFAATESQGAVKNDVLYISYNQDMTREYIDTCAFWAKHYGKGCEEIEEFLFEDDDPEKHIKAFRIQFASGNEIIALSSRPTNLRGKQGRVVIDEAAFVENLAELLKAALALLMWGGQVVVLSTHNGEDNPFAELVEEVRAGKRPYSLHRITLDDALADGLFRRISLVKGQPWSAEAEAAWRAKLVAQYADAADEELFCIPSKGGVTYFTLNIIEACMRDDIPVVAWSPPAVDFVDWPDDRRYREAADWCRAELEPLLARLPRSGRQWFGEDFGRDQDLTVIWPLVELPDLTRRTPFVLELRDCPFTQQEQILFYVGDRLPGLAGGALDKGGNGSFLAERARQRWGAERIEQVHLYAGWYMEHMPPAKAALEDRAVLIPKDVMIRDDLRAIKRVKGVPQPPDVRTQSRDAGKRHADSAVAFVLAEYARRKFEGGGPVEVAAALPLTTTAMLRGY